MSQMKIFVRKWTEIAMGVRKCACKPDSVDLSPGLTIIPLGRQLLASSSHLPARPGSTVQTVRPVRAYLVLLQVGFT